MGKTATLNIRVNPDVKENAENRLTGRRLEALHLYLTDGTSYQLYTGLAVPQNRVKEAAWYRAARQRPGEVCVGVAVPLAGPIFFWLRWLSIPLSPVPWEVQERHCGVQRRRKAPPHSPAEARLFFI